MVARLLGQHLEKGRIAYRRRQAMDGILSWSSWGRINGGLLARGRVSL